MSAAGELDPNRLPTTVPTILIVEDDPLIRMVLSEVFREAGLAVVEATSADDAWRYIDAGGVADLVITDIHMPGQMDGRRLAAHLKQQFPHLIVIVASGNPGQLPSVEFEHFLHKPFDMDGAVELVLRLLGKERRASSDDPIGSN